MYQVIFAEACTSPSGCYRIAIGYSRPNGLQRERLHRCHLDGSSAVFCQKYDRDDSTGCNAHSSYYNTAKLIAPDGTQVSGTSSGLVGNASKPINNQTGTWTA